MDRSINILGVNSTCLDDELHCHAGREFRESGMSTRASYVFGLSTRLIEVVFSLQCRTALVFHFLVMFALGRGEQDYEFSFGHVSKIFQ